ncbi:hypothetical protein [Paenibacillus pectinilyticus]|uniref:hypothetical protein n=1 Tax=Paenibacillus pectinilyticus TaxID=512399 RepID=UPI0014289835|nr:hypothetical protein [Paenibacillus pectinilyticus]
MNGCGASTEVVAGCTAGAGVAVTVVVTATAGGLGVAMAVVASLQPARVRTEHPSTSHELRILLGISGNVFNGAAPLFLLDYRSMRCIC